MINSGEITHSMLTAPPQNDECINNSFRIERLWFDRNELYPVRLDFYRLWYELIGFTIQLNTMINLSQKVGNSKSHQCLGKAIRIVNIVYMLKHCWRM